VLLGVMLSGKSVPHFARAQSENVRGFTRDEIRALSAGQRANYAAPTPGSPRMSGMRSALSSNNASVALGRASRSWVEDENEEAGYTQTLQPRRSETRSSYAAPKRRSMTAPDSRDDVSDTSRASYRLQSQASVASPRPSPREANGFNGRPAQMQQNTRAAESDWWQSEAKRMREEALKMRTERDRFRAAVEDAHFECRRLAAQVQEFQSSLRTTQVALKEANAVADAARSELERLRLWVEEAHTETKRMSVEVQEYEVQLRQTKATLEEAERSCQEMKIDNDEMSTENTKLQRRIKQLEESFKAYSVDGTMIIPAVEDARAETERVRMELDARLSELEDLKQQNRQVLAQSESQLRDIEAANDVERQTLELAVEELKKHVSAETVQEVQQLLNQKFQEQWQDGNFDDIQARRAEMHNPGFDDEDDF